MIHAELDGEIQFNSMIISAHLSMREGNVSLSLSEIVRPKADYLEAYVKLM